MENIRRNVRLGDFLVAMGIGCSVVVVCSRHVNCIRACGVLSRRVDSVAVPVPESTVAHTLVVFDSVSFRLLDLPHEILVLAFSFLDAKSLSRVAATCVSLFRDHVNPVVDALRLRAASLLRSCPDRLFCGLTSWASYLAWLECRRDEAWFPASTGSSSSFFVGSGGCLLSCGSESADERGFLGHGELDDGAFGIRSPSPVPSMIGIRISGVWTGCGFCAVVCAGGSVYTWGNGYYGCLGHGDTYDVLVPRKVISIRDTRVISLATGQFHCLAVTEDGGVVSWGHSQFGRCGYWVPSCGENGLRPVQSRPRCVDALHAVRARRASAFGYHSLVVTESGALYSFGSGAHGVGSCCGADYCELPPTHVTSLRHVRIVAAVTGGRHVVALASDGTVFSWGCNFDGQLGLGCFGVGEPLPKVVVALCGVGVVFIAAGFGSSYAVASDGEIFAWGNGQSGKLGHGESVNMCTPMLVDACRGMCVVAVSAGHRHSTVAVMRDGSVFGWGSVCGFGLPDVPLYNSGGAVCSAVPCRYRRLSCLHN